MVRKSFFIVAAGVIVFIAGAAWAGPQINPGKWEITTKTEMAGMPSQSMTHTQCITNDDLVPVNEEASQECEITDIKISGNTVTWEMTCGSGNEGMDGSGEVVYGEDSMNGTMTMIMKNHGTQMKNTFSGRRIGDCDATEAGTSGRTSSGTPGTSGNAVGRVLADDAKDVGKAAKDEAKQSTIDEVREGVRDVFKGLFK